MANEKTAKGITKVKHADWGFGAQQGTTALQHCCRRPARLKGLVNWQLGLPLAFHMNACDPFCCLQLQAVLLFRPSKPLAPCSHTPWLGSPDGFLVSEQSTADMRVHICQGESLNQGGKALVAFCKTARCQLGNNGLIIVTVEERMV